MQLRQGDKVRTPTGCVGVVEGFRTDGRAVVRYLGDTPTSGLPGISQRSADCRQVVLAPSLLVRA